MPTDAVVNKLQINLKALLKLLIIICFSINGHWKHSCDNRLISETFLEESRREHLYDSRKDSEFLSRSQNKDKWIPLGFKNSSSSKELIQKWKSNHTEAPFKARNQQWTHVQGELWTLRNAQAAHQENRQNSTEEGILIVCKCTEVPGKVLDLTIGKWVSCLPTRERGWLESSHTTGVSPGVTTGWQSPWTQCMCTHWLLFSCVELHVTTMCTCCVHIGREVECSRRYYF